MPEVPGYKKAMIDWLVAHGEPMATFGPGCQIAAEESRADLARTGIDYDASRLGDLTGQSWTEDTFTEARTHPGLWADIVPVGGQMARSTGRGQQERWLVDGNDYTFTLDEVIRGVLDAGQAGEDYWRRLVTPEQQQQAAERAEEHARFHAYLAAQPGSSRYVSSPSQGRKKANRLP